MPKFGHPVAIYTFILRAFIHIISASGSTAIVILFQDPQPSSLVYGRKEWHKKEGGIVGSSLSDGLRVINPEFFAKILEYLIERYGKIIDKEIDKK